MKRLPIFIAAYLLLQAGCLSEDKQTNSKEIAEEQREKLEENEIEKDIEFLLEAANAGLMEVQLGQLAQQKGRSPKVREFGTSMVVDHIKATEEMKELASRKNIVLRDKPGESDQKLIQELTKKSGDDFDKAYMQMVIDGHQKDINRFQEEAEKGKDPEIKAFATGKLPDLLQHMQHATTINNSIRQNQL